MQRWLSRGALRLLAVLAGIFLASSQPASAGAFVPSESLIQGVRGEGRVLMDPSGVLGVADIEEKFNAGEGQAIPPGEALPAGGGKAWWYQLKLPEVTSTTRVAVTLPYAGIDRVEFYRPEGLGWRMQAAGDTIAVKDWPLRNLTPVFRFDLEPAETRHSYMRVIHGPPLRIYWQVWDGMAFFENAKLSHMGLGAYMGLVTLLIVLGVVYASSWRDTLPLVFAAHVLMAALTHLSLAGLAGEYLWPGWAWWNDVAPGVLAVLTMSLLHLFVREFVAERGARWLSRLLVGMMAIGGLIALGFLEFGRALYIVSSTYYIASFALLLGVSFWYARRNPAMGYWVLGGIGLLTLCATLTILRNLNVLPLMPLTQYGAQMGLFLEIPFLFVALHRHNREKRGNRTRVHDMKRVDPLTGAASHQVMMQRLQQLIQRQGRDPELGAVVRVRVSNGVDIRQEYGVEASQNAIVHAGYCINWLLKEGDSIARHRDGDFLMLLGGRVKREELTELGQRLIARGLHASSRLPPGTVLQLKLAIASAPFPVNDGELLLQSLNTTLNDLSARPGKALRFIE